MEYLNHIHKLKNTYAVYGSFDGVHKGHLAVLKELAERGESLLY